MPKVPLPDGVVEFDKLDPRLVYRILNELRTPKAKNSLSRINGRNRVRYVQTLRWNDLITETGYRQIRKIPEEWVDEDVAPDILIDTSVFATYYQITSK